MSFRPPPSRLELIRLNRQIAFFRRVRKTLEDARNSTIQRIRAIVAELEEDRRRIADAFSEIAASFKMAVAKEGIDKIEALAELTPKTVRVEQVNRGIYVGIEVRGYSTHPIYSIATEAAELDVALVKMRELMERLIAFAEKETLFYALLHRVKEYQRMINAIDHVIMPRIRENIRYIRLALEEGEREEFIRRKIISALT